MKIDNIVIKNIDLDHSREIIKTFVEFGVKNKVGLVGSVYQNVYYGVIHGRFDVYEKSETNRPNIKIITLEQLKAMKDKSEYPKLMWVGDNEHQVKLKNTKRVVFMEKNGLFFSWLTAESLKESEKINSVTSWKYAQDIETPDPKKEIIDIAMNEDILKYAIIKINGKEVEYKK